MKKNYKVGIFDSGIGGLTVLHACRQFLPEVAFYYLGDNGNAPYGRRPEREIAALTRNALFEFEALGTDAVVLACNTATAVCAESLRRAFGFPIVGMEPAVRPAASGHKSVLVLCTPKTAGSERLCALISRFPRCRITVCPLPKLAAAVENSLTRGEPLTLSDHLPPAYFDPSTRDPDYDGVVLGCTHYIYFREEIGQFYNVPVYDGNLGTAKRLADLLSAGGGDHFEPPYLGTDDHKKHAIVPPIFLGKWAEINEKTYKTNKRFQFFYNFSEKK